MSDEASKMVVGLLIDSLQTEAKKHLPGYVDEAWLNALSDVLQSGLYHAWIAIIDQHIVRIEADTVTVVDERKD
tara:strand:- start:1263 stop:1484 length:222 start_codon:yes stop_codon:yes gene_type:complete